MAEKKTKPVMSVENGQVYASASEAAKAVGCKVNSIYTAIKHKKRLKGYHWTYEGITAQTAAPDKAEPRELANVIHREVDAVFSRRSDNHFNELQAALMERGIEMRFTDGRGDLSFSKGGQTVTGEQLGLPLYDLIARSRQAGRPVEACSETLQGVEYDALPDEKDRKIAKLEQKVSSLEATLSERERHITSLEGNLCELVKSHKEVQKLSVETQKYWVDALRRYEMAVTESFATLPSGESKTAERQGLFTPLKCLFGTD